jgi:hypothetical protein
MYGIAAGNCAPHKTKGGALLKGTTMFKLTFNKPSVKMFFAGEDAVGIQIKVEGTKVFFKPIHRIEPDQLDVVPITERDRGGAQATIEGSRANELLNLLTNPLGNPYYLLKRTSGGWMEATPHSGPKYSPERWEAHIRVWPRDTAAAISVDDDRFNADPAPAYPVLPVEEQARETLQKLEEKVRNVTRAPAHRQFAAMHEARGLIDRYLALFAENPLPNQKIRKPRTVHIKSPTPPVRVESPQVFRRQRERAFGSLPH